MAVVQSSEVDAKRAPVNGVCETLYADTSSEDKQVLITPLL
jgi:hypothetical protein